MFSNDVTKNYTQQDATLEILIMLAGAFILGCLLCWLIRKLKGLDNEQNITSRTSQSNDHYRRDHQIVEDTNMSPEPHSLSEKMGHSESKLSAQKTISAEYTTQHIDDLTKISGIDSDIETELRQRGIKSYSDLRDSNKQTIIDTLESTTSQNISTKEAQTWPHQANLAAKGEWEKLNEYQLFMKRTKKAAENIKQQTENDIQAKKDKQNANTSDDLKKIEGIGPKIEEVLNNNAIHTFKDLRMSDRDTLKSHLDNAGNRFKMHEPESWPHQAGMAERDEWEELKIYQEFMDGGREKPSLSASSQIDTPAIKPIIDDVEAEYNVELTKDDLKKIEGIGPKIEEILNKQGISTFAELHEKDRDTLKGYLDKAGNQFKMHEPESWPHQAGMAATGQWEELAIYQDFMDGGRETPSGSSSSKKLSNTTSINKKESDDFKKIEGIGPKIQELLNKSGVKTYKVLSKTKVDTIKALLDAAGPQYRMHDPKTWPTQAEMADKNMWEELEIYQDQIINDRSK